MTAQVTKVEAFKSIDGEVFDTHQKAHYRNILVLCYRAMGTSIGDTDNEDWRNAANFLYRTLIAPNGAPSRMAREAVAALAKELE